MPRQSLIARVVNELRQNDSPAQQNQDLRQTRLQPYRTTIAPLDNGEDAVDLGVNPAPYTDTADAEWSRRGAAAVTPDRSDWLRSGPRTVSFEVTLAGYTEADGAKLYTRLETLRRWQLEPTRSTQEPTRVVLQMGQAVAITGRIARCEWDTVDTLPSGLPRLVRFRFAVEEL